MNKAQDIRIEDYDYQLPDERIAKFPLSQRDASKLLVCKDGNINEDTFNRVERHVPQHSLLVFNNTKVIQARMIFQKDTGAQIEIFCLEPRKPDDYSLNFAQTGECEWECLIGNVKRWKEGTLKKRVHGARYTVQGVKEDEAFELYAERIESYGESHLVRFYWNETEASFADILELCGELPIPPYLNRKTEEEDKKTYQTIYSRIKGSVAAPTAGLHFTEDVLGSLRNKGVGFEEVTLHVGAGTFKPVKSETIGGHTMHSECFTIKKSTIEQLSKHRGNVIAVGTTSVRTLESIYYIGAMLENNPKASLEQLEVGQWTPYEAQNNRLQTEKALDNVLIYLEKNKLSSLTTHTQIMIVPGYSFKIVNGIITNFHQPKSTLLLLISAFLNGNWKAVYNYALAHDFRFLSYGDSSILLK